jgi:hypothetical protein
LEKMEINATEFIQIMSKNFRYDVVNTKLGQGIKVDPFKAFIYSSITGAGYLDDFLYPFTPKGLTKLFYNALSYNFVTGIFDNSTLKNTPYLMAQSKRYLFDSNKTIVPVEFSSEDELQSKLKKFISQISEPSTNFIIQRIEKTKKGNGMEPFMEYIACEVMKTKDFIVENQIPLSHSNGSPDFGGYRLSKNTNFKRIHLIELSLLRLGWEINSFGESNNNYCIVGEAKTSTFNMKKQIQKYLATKFFNECFEIHPSKLIPSDAKCGLITIAKDYSIKVIQRKNKEILFNSRKQDEYISWLSNYIKYYLVANLTNDEFLEFYMKKRKQKLQDIKDVVEFVNSLSYDEILNKIEEVCHGTFKR